jgi:hypothetical protein
MPAAAEEPRLPGRVSFLNQIILAIKFGFIEL